MNLLRVTVTLASMALAGCAWLDLPSEYTSFAITIGTIVVVFVAAMLLLLSDSTGGGPAISNLVSPPDSHEPLTAQQVEAIREALAKSMEGGFGPRAVLVDGATESEGNCSGCGAPLELGSTACSWCKRSHRRTK